ncbi:MAG: sigma-70 family RNA polymerase sigma factor [Planctomycetes bacterium]|nr:sigma-70 family RNA polymerase sigma factor [Planctomycetota bacterium]
MQPRDPVDFPETRWSLIGRLGERPAEATTVVETYAGSIDRYLRRRLAGCDASTADDVVQDVLVHLLDHAEVLARARAAPDSRFRHYLMTVAWNEARNALRRRRPRASDVSTNDAEIAVGPEEMVAMDRAWAESVLARAWAELHAWAADGTIDGEVPAVLEASLVEGLPLREIAERLGIGLATASRRLAHGRTLVQGAITERLRHAGELGEHEDAAVACARLLALLHR